MSNIGKKELEHLAYLSRLALTDTESKKFLRDLEAIVGYVKELEIVDTNHIQPLIGAANAKNIVRGDVVDQDAPVVTKETAERIRNAFPASEKNYLKVPKIL